MKTLFTIILCYIFIYTSHAQLRLDYYYDQSEMYTKFSDWIPKRLHQWHPKYVEDFFLLYSLKQHYGEQALLRDIHFLQLALKKRFRHPRNALVLVETKQEYHKYRLLIFMHINLKIMRSFLRLGSLFDKRHLYFYNLDFADELKESFKIAEFYYQKATPYWVEAKKLAQEAHQYTFEIDLSMLESIRYEIMTGDINFDTYIKNHLNKLKLKQNTTQQFINENK